MANTVYNIAKKKAIDGQFDWASLDVRVLLIKSTYAVDPDHQFVSDLTPGTNELSGTGYTRKTMANEATSQDDAGDRADGDGDDLVWSGINAGTAQAAVLFVQVTNDTDSWLIGYVDTGGFPIATNGADLQITWNAEGILQFV